MPSEFLNIARRRAAHRQMRTERVSERPPFGTVTWPSQSERCTLFTVFGARSASASFSRCTCSFVIASSGEIVRTIRTMLGRHLSVAFLCRDKLGLRETRWSVARYVCYRARGWSARRIPRALWPIVQRKLDQVDSVTKLEDLKVPPGNRLHALVDDMAGYHAIRVNDQYRIVFRFTGHDAYDVRCTDYH